MNKEKEDRQESLGLMMTRGCKKIRLIVGERHDHCYGRLNGEMHLLRDEDLPLLL